TQASAAGAAAAGAAQNAAAAATAAAAAAASAGAAQSQAAKARQAAAEANAAASRATRAAATSQTLANRAAAAARTARDAANSAATHAEKAAAAADEAAANAGKAIEYAKRSTAHAEAAVEAANTAANAVKEAQAVEEAARTAEAAQVAEDTELGVKEARLLAQSETEDAARLSQGLTQAAVTSQEIKDLIASAETALRDGDAAAAATVGRKAAVRLLDASGSWTREAAEFALSGTDHDLINWIDTDRLLAQRQDDRESVLAVAEVAGAAVASAAHEALASDDPDAAHDFIEHGAIEAAATDNRVAVFTILAQNPGKTVKEKADAALRDGSAEALHRFLSVELAEATKVDDSVEIFTLLESGGLYMRSAAQIVLEGSARMRRAFVTHDKFNIARLDHDQAAHVSAIRAAIAHAAKIAAKALENAALASKAAAEARQAAKEASDWAAKADGFAKNAASSAAEAKSNADAADKSASAAAQSAKDAAAAALTARTAARSANYSLHQAVTSARQAVSFAVDAQASATQARASAQQAGKDAEAAAEAASQARSIVAAKRQAEAVEAARKAAEKAKENERTGTNPADTPENDDTTGDVKWWGLWPKDMGDLKDWAKATGHWSSALGSVSVVAALASFIPWATPVAGPIAVTTGIASWGLQGVSAVLSGFGYGWDSSEFHSALGMFVIGGMFFGKGKLFSKFDVAEAVGAKVSGIVGDTVTTVVGWLTW
ncbi:ALF repeat-containing protein, partial [Streptomyces griseolus]